MLRSSIMSDDPVVIMETRMLYPTKGMVRLEVPVEEIGGARIVRPGKDVTIVTWGSMVRSSTAAAELLEEHGVSAEVVDLRWLSPLDMSTVEKSVARTGRLVVVHEANLTGGFGAEIAARCADVVFDSLMAPIVRVATPDVHFPASPALQEPLLPNARTIAEAAKSTVNYRRG
jgi:pyruvate/2-oxoglutarate/acetoin dehydrogenase E1 component